MLINAKITPRSEAFEIEYPKEVELTPYKHIKSVGLAICLVVLSLYMIFT
jgi:SSS family solute:Na+ symporter